MQNQKKTSVFETPIQATKYTNKQKKKDEETNMLHNLLPTKKDKGDKFKKKSEEFDNTIKMYKNGFNQRFSKFEKNNDINSMLKNELNLNCKLKTNMHDIKKCIENGIQLVTLNQSNV